jgi:RNA polymerase sigma-70 factor (ECF subfamily)
MSTNPSFQELLASHQERILNYVISLLGDHDAAWDILQETNKTLLQKQEEFEPGTSFVNWALTVAKFKTLTWLRDKKRDRVIVTTEIVELIAEEAVSVSSESDQEQALSSCLESLNDGNRELLHLRYAKSLPLSLLSEQTGKSVNALKQVFFRLRASLEKCIKQQLETS